MNPDLYDRRLPLFPLTTLVKESQAKKHLTIAGCDLHELVDQWGTPLYLYDRLTLDTAVENYQRALAEFYPGGSGVTYAGKAFLCTAIAQWAQEHQLLIDCTGAGELAIASQAQVPRQQILVHGVNKSQADLQAALSGAGTIVVDNLSELRRLAALAKGYPGPIPDLWLRLRPGIAVQTHAYTQTGQDDSKFGLSPTEFIQAVRICQTELLPLTGLHFHQGSHFHDPSPLGPAIETALDLIQEVRSTSGWAPQILCPGGGWGVPYHEDDLPHLSILDYVRFISEHLIEGCRRRNLELPRLQLEPGRSLVAQAGVALYRVDTVKTTPHQGWLLLDGGLADNPRPALYQARYSALPVEEPQRPVINSFHLAGPYCESGDILIHGLPMPDIQPGELVAIPVSGAYQLSMGSNYNGARKPAVLWLDHGKASLIQRRETLEDLVRRDLPLPS
jgi:diaminopimelate decarboxylase